MEYHTILQHYPDWCYNEFGEIHFADFTMVRIPDHPAYSVDFLGKSILKIDPPGFKYLVKLRDLMVKPFGLKTSEDLVINEQAFFEKGSVMIYFPVLVRDKQTIVVGEKDKHLDFRIIMRIEKSNEPNQLIFKLSTIVKYNNKLGRIYFSVIKPFHNYFMRYTIQKLKQRI